MTIKNQRRIVALLLAMAAVLGWAGQEFGWFGASAARLEQNQPGLYEIVRFSDGDTIAVNMNGREETVRMIGVDTPETHAPGKPVQCYGPAASAYTKQLIGTQKVRLEADPANQNRDRYDRLLRYVYLPDGQLVQASIIQNGYGFAYTSFPFTKKDEFVTLEASAKTEAKGLWANCTVTDQNGRKQTNPQ